MGAQNEVPRTIPVRKKKIKLYQGILSEMGGNWPRLEVGAHLGLLS